MYISDMVLLAKLPEDLKNDRKLLAGCVACAVLKEEYLRLLKRAGFSVKILAEDSDIKQKAVRRFARRKPEVESLV